MENTTPEVCSITTYNLSRLFCEDTEEHMAQRGATEQGIHDIVNGPFNMAREMSWEEDTSVHLPKLPHGEPVVHNADDVAIPSPESPHMVGLEGSLRIFLTLLAILCLPSLAVHGGDPSA